MKKLIIVILSLGVIGNCYCQSGAEILDISAEVNYTNKEVPDSIMSKLYIQIMLTSQVFDGDSAKAQDAEVWYLDVLDNQMRFKSKKYLIYYFRGVVKQFLKDYTGSISDLSRCLDLDPKYGRGYYDRGLSKFRLKDMRGAIDDITKSISINPDYELAYYWRASAKIELKDYAGAITDGTKGIQIQPRYAGNYLVRGWARIQLKYKDSGCMDLSKAGELGLDGAYDLIKQCCQ